MDQKSAFPEIDRPPVEALSGPQTTGSPSAGTLPSASSDPLSRPTESEQHPSTTPAVEVAKSPGGTSLPVLKIPLTQDEPVLWLRRADQGFIAICVAIGLALLSYHWVRLSRWGAEPIEIDRLPERRADYRININQATIYEFIELDGIGPALAKQIIENREQHGPFNAPEDLQRVRGIGPKIFEKLSPHLTVRDDAIIAPPKPGRKKR